MIQNLAVVINPKNLRPEHSVLLEIRDALAEVEFKYSVHVSTPSHSITEIVRALGQDVDTILVYGGDGSFMEVVNAVYVSRQNFHPQIQLGILPGGTANVMAKEVEVPESITTSLTNILAGDFNTKKIDLGVLNGEPFFLRVNVGGLATMVTDTSEAEKSSLGSLAYSLSGIQKLFEQDTVANTFKMTIDGKKVTEKGIGLMITNSGNIGLKGVSIFSDISITDGLLDIILIERVNFGEVIQIAAERLLGNEDLDRIKRWKASKVIIELAESQTIIRDDTELAAQKLEIAVRPSEIKMILPKGD